MSTSMSRLIITLVHNSMNEKYLILKYFATCAKSIQLRLHTKNIYKDSQLNMNDKLIIILGSDPTIFF